MIWATAATRNQNKLLYYITKKRVNDDFDAVFVFFLWRRARSKTFKIKRLPLARPWVRIYLFPTMYIVYTVVYFESSYCILMPLHIETYLCMAQMSWPGTHTLYSWPFYMLNMILLTSSYTVCTAYSLLCFLNKNIGSENNLSSSNRCRGGGGGGCSVFRRCLPNIY